MTRSVFCQRLKQEAEGLDFAPWPGELGQKIFASISKEAWKQWLNRQTMFINEYRLNLLEPQAKEFLREEMVRFLFEAEDVKPAGYTEQSSKA